jgi:Trypsin-like peptidase domain
MLERLDLRRRSATAGLAAFLLACFLAGGAGPGSATDAPLPAAAVTVYEGLLTSSQDALVTVKFVLQVKIGGSMAAALGGDQELENEVTCVVIDGGGLVLCSNTLFNAYVDLMAQMVPAGIELSPVPKDIKILTGKDGEELSASLVVRDSDRDLVWLQIDDAGERAFPFVDFSHSAEPALGDEMIAVWRMDRYFERRAVLSASRLGGILQRPRRLLMPATPFTGGLGSPVFDAAGRAVGLLISQVPDDGSLTQSDNPFATMGQSLRLQQGVQGLILPASEIVKATLQVSALENQE